MALTILTLSFLLLLALGVPVAFAIGLSAICTILYEGLPVAVLFQQMMSGMNIFSFLAMLVAFVVNMVVKVTIAGFAGSRQLLAMVGPPLAAMTAAAIAAFVLT